MKNIKKLIMMTSLLTIGITTMGALKSEEEFKIGLNVINSLNLEVGGNLLDLGVVNSTTVSNRRATEWIKVTGPANTQLKIEVPEKTTITNGDSSIDVATFVSTTENGSSVGTWGAIGSNGEYNAFMVALINHANVEKGEYTGTVTLKVSYS